MTPSRRIFLHGVRAYLAEAARAGELTGQLAPGNRRIRGEKDTFGEIVLLSRIYPALAQPEFEGRT